MARGGKRSGAGRPAGALNKATRDIREAAQEYTDLALQVLVDVATNGDSAAAKVAAANAILDRAHGKPRGALDVDANVAAILAIDMSGFSQLMEEQGVESALQAVAHLQEVATAATEAHGGRIVKFWADNVLATFGAVSDAMKAAEATLVLVPASAGIGFGEIQELEADIFGLEVNRACRLGEDVAQRGEILLTDAAQSVLTNTTSSKPGTIYGR